MSPFEAIERILDVAPHSNFEHVPQRPLERCLFSPQLNKHEKAQYEYNLRNRDGQLGPPAPPLEADTRKIASATALLEEGVK